MMNIDWETILATLRAGRTLDRAAAAAAVDAMMEGRGAPGTIKEFLVRLHERGETAEELAGAAESMRKHMVPVDTNRDPLIDTCGTGGDDSGTFNISTAAAIVTAACGVAVAKHGNRSVTSRTGSADVLESLGVAIDLEPDQVGRCIDEIGIGFCFAPRMHPAMREVASIRREIATPTLFNLLGPLANPASAPYQLIGVGRASAFNELAKAVALLGTARPFLVKGQDGLDEVTTAAPTDVIEVDGRGARFSHTWRPVEFGFRTAPFDSARVENAAESADMIRRVLSGASGVARQLVLINAAAALALVDTMASMTEHVRRAAEAIDSGDALRLLDAWIEASHS